MLRARSGDREAFEHALNYFEKTTNGHMDRQQFVDEYYKQDDSHNYHLGLTDGRVMDAFLLLILSARRACLGADGFKDAALLAARASERLLAEHEKAKKLGLLAF